MQAVHKMGPKWLSNEMAKRGWSTRKAAKELGCSAATVCRWVNGLVMPKSEHIRAMRDKLNILPDAWF